MQRSHNHLAHRFDKMYPVSDTYFFAARYKSGESVLLKKMHTKKQRQHNKAIVVEQLEEHLEALYEFLYGD